eukprot:CAMPEP_0206578320 /NCGR_PEP_ID=MMETSP0325_2-20121206/31892_1 /ASSEMBLY_ACC=CAM_ASM_000347 /TAXON_ID=2866 /ORGANISM="Crypthecodinium cohnii, Strain Seligo" /LENGTH=61 /DNA_ID=CAMNT_0054083935 /DNA_START=457 /DNA_END=642 /DNA_ORIENTATION=+
MAQSFLAFEFLGPDAWVSVGAVVAPVLNRPLSRVSFMVSAPSELRSMQASSSMRIAISVSA